MKTDRIRISTAVLVLSGLVLAGCETAPPKTADYWPAATYLTVVVHGGDTVSEIAGRYGVPVATVQRMNDLTATTSIYPGEKLKLPANAHQTRTAVLHEAEQPKYASWNAPGKTSRAAVEVHDLEAPPSKDPAEHHPALKEAAKDDSASAQVAPVPTPRDDPLASEASDEIHAASSQKKDEPAQSPKAKTDGEKTSDASAPAGFRWPMEGRVIAAFGKAEDGQRNDGINIAANLGEPIHAAAEGTVTYAGSELKDYGNLVLIKHDNGYVTAYAHAESITVSRGDRVKRGEVIGYAGKTGDVATPQLHFEIRQGVKPVDPRPLLLASRDS